MADLQVPEVLFLRPASPAASRGEKNSSQAITPQTSGIRASGTRSVRDVMEDLRRAERTSEFADVRPTMAGESNSFHVVDQPGPEVPGPHFRSSLLREEPASDMEPSGASAGPVLEGLRWPTKVLELSRRCQVQFDAIGKKISGRSRVGIIGLEPNCGVTTIAAAVALSCFARHNRRPANQRIETILIDANLARPAISTFVETSRATAWQEWTTISSESLRNAANPCDQLKLPGGNGMRVWPISCGICAEAAPLKAAGIGAERDSDTVRYFLPVQAAGPIAQTLSRVVDQLAASGNMVIADLGHLDHWRQLQHLATIAKAFDQIMLIVPEAPDRRQVSKAIWELQDLGQTSCLLIENLRF
ncbi:MAG: hypothetical protein JNL67_05575 [Planctomycetaceae bacterium]|nr:hypothetical protein [Planctomycetaceae bacterium]